MPMNTQINPLRTVIDSLIPPLPRSEQKEPRGQFVREEAAQLISDLLEKEREREPFGMPREPPQRIPKRYSERPPINSPFAGLDIPELRAKEAEETRRKYEPVGAMMRRMLGLAPGAQLPGQTAAAANVPAEAPEASPEPAAEPFDPNNPKITAIYQDQEKRMRAVYLRPPYTWHVFGPNPGHWEEQLFNDERVLPEDRDEIRQKLTEMFRE